MKKIISILLFLLIPSISYSQTSGELLAEALKSYNSLGNNLTVEQKLQVYENIEMRF